VPTALRAATKTVWLAISALYEVPVTLSTAPPALIFTLYPMIALPPLLAGADHITVPA
jgi:hypothetical protein